MDPLVLYIALFAAAVAFFALASVIGSVPTRACPSCGDETPVQGRRCRHCGYGLSAT